MTGKRLHYSVMKGEFGEHRLFDQYGVRHAIPSSRKAAIAKSSPIYKGQACRNCHGVLRYTSNYNCIPCSTWNVSSIASADRQKAYRARKKARLHSPMAELIKRILYST